MMLQTHAHSLTRVRLMCPCLTWAARTVYGESTNKNLILILGFITIIRGFMNLFVDLSCMDLGACGPCVHV